MKAYSYNFSIIANREHWRRSRLTKNVKNKIGYQYQGHFVQIKHRRPILKQYRMELKEIEEIKNYENTNVKS